MTKIITTLPDPPWDDSITHNLEIRDMTHAEEATKLIRKFYEEVKVWKTAKRCALIAIELILENNRELLESQLNNDFSIMDNSNNWRLIKAEIEKL